LLADPLECIPRLLAESESEENVQNRQRKEAPPRELNDLDISRRSNDIDLGDLSVYRVPRDPWKEGRDEEEGEDTDESNANSHGHTYRQAPNEHGGAQGRTRLEMNSELRRVDATSMVNRDTCLSSVGV